MQIEVGYTADKLVVITVTEGDNVTQLPLLDYEATELARRLNETASVVRGYIQEPKRIILPKGVVVPVAPSGRILP